VLSVVPGVSLPISLAIHSKNPGSFCPPPFLAGFWVSSEYDPFLPSHGVVFRRLCARAEMEPCLSPLTTV